METIASNNARRTDLQTTIASMENRLRAAQVNADVTELDALISSNLLFTGPTGELITKEQDLSAHRSGFIRFKTYETKDLQIRLVGEGAAIAAVKAFLVVNVDGNDVSGMYRYTRIWAREEGGDWRVVGGHVSIV